MLSAIERRFPRHLDAAVLVRVGLDRSGRPVRLSALDRLVVRGTGDYSFAIPAPATSVAVGPGSQSAPGLRSGVVLWQGFSAGNRVLVARIVLDASRGAAALPVRLTIRRGELRLENSTATHVTVTTGHAAPASLAAAFDAARAAVRSAQLLAAPAVTFVGPARTEELLVRARLHVTGSYRFTDGRTRRLATSLDEEPLRVSGRGDLRGLALRVDAESPLEPLRAADPRDFRTAARLTLESALAAQYQRFLANPDPAGKSATSYRFAFAAPEAARADADGSSNPWLAIGIAAAAAVAAAGGVVLWAHS
jgi:hypothetical protein